MIATKKSCPNESPTQPPKIPILNTLQNYFTTKSSNLLQHTNYINDGKTTKHSTTTKKTATLIQKIKIATTFKLQKLSKRSESKNKKSILTTIIQYLINNHIHYDQDP